MSAPLVRSNWFKADVLAALVGICNEKAGILRTPKQMLKRPVAWVAGVLVIVILFIAWFLVKEERRHPGHLESLLIMPGFAVREHQYRTNFNSAVWINPGSVPDVQLNPGRLTIRVRMIDDLLNSHDFAGNSGEEMEQLLGKRSGERHFEGWDWHYYLGAGRYGDAIGDSEWLVFRFNSRGRVADFKVIHD